MFEDLDGINVFAPRRDLSVLLDGRLTTSYHVRVAAGSWCAILLRYVGVAVVCTPL